METKAYGTEESGPKKTKLSPYNAAVLNLWVMPPSYVGGEGGEGPFHRGHIPDILHITYFRYNS